MSFAPTYRSIADGIQERLGEMGRVAARLDAGSPARQAVDALLTRFRGNMYSVGASDIESHVVQLQQAAVEAPEVEPLARLAGEVLGLVRAHDDDYF